MLTYNKKFLNKKNGLIVRDAHYLDEDTIRTRTEAELWRRRQERLESDNTRGMIHDNVTEEIKLIEQEIGEARCAILDTRYILSKISELSDGFDNKYLTKDYADDFIKKMMGYHNKPAEVKEVKKVGIFTRIYNFFF